MVAAIQDLRSQLPTALGSTTRIAIELNTSCPNIKGAPPPAYNFPSLTPLLQVLADFYYKDTSLTIGLKLPPYVYSTQFDEVIKEISGFTKAVDSYETQNAFAFFTCTNTLGSSLLFAEQAVPLAPNLGGSQFALPTALGGLAGESIHALSLGNVHTFSRLLANADPPLRAIKIIGVGGVTSPEAVLRMRYAGASVVGCATLLGRDGVDAFRTLSVGVTQDQ